MAYTSHGKHIPGTDTELEPDMEARCGGVGNCEKCSEEARAYLFKPSVEGEDYQIKARRLVAEYVDSRLDKSDEPAVFEVYVVWFSKTLQNWKALLSTTLPDGMYYEVTHNGDKHETYLDAYKKFDNVVISD